MQTLILRFLSLLSKTTIVHLFDNEKNRVLMKEMYAFGLGDFVFLDCYTI